MANTTLTQTGAQVQADLDKVEGMANIKTVGSGLSLSSAGQLSASGGNSGSGLVGGTVTLRKNTTLPDVGGCIVEYVDINFIYQYVSFNPDTAGSDIVLNDVLFLFELTSPSTMGQISITYNGLREGRNTSAYYFDNVNKVGEITFSYGGGGN